MKLADLQPRMVRLSGLPERLTPEQRIANRRRSDREFWKRNAASIRLKKRVREMR